MVVESKDDRLLPRGGGPARLFLESRSRTSAISSDKPDADSQILSEPSARFPSALSQLSDNAMLSLSLPCLRGPVRGLSENSLACCGCESDEHDPERNDEGDSSECVPVRFDEESTIAGRRDRRCGLRGATTFGYGNNLLVLSVLARR